MTLQLLHSEFPYTVYEENSIFLSVYCMFARAECGSSGYVLYTVLAFNILF